MEFRRSGTGDERRRKVLLDESTAERMLAPSAEPPTNTAKKTDAIARAYAAAAHDETETRVADLIPTRPLGVVVFVLLGLCAIAAVQLAYTFLPDWYGVFGARACEVLDVTSRGSLAAWLSSVMLGTSSLTALLVYAIRRHKADDYRGRYRLWLWCAALLLIASVNAVAGLHEMFELVAVKLSGSTLLSRGPAWAMSAMGLVGLALGVLTLLESWRSRISATAIAIVGLLYATATYFMLFAAPPTTMLAVMIASSVTLAAHLALLVALLLYARHVLLESRGLIKARPKKKRVPKPKAAKKPVKEKIAKPAKVEAADEEDDEEEDEPPPPAKKPDRIIKIDPPHNKTVAASTANKPVATPAKTEAKAAAKKEEPPAKQPGPLSRLIGFGKKPAETPPPPKVTNKAVINNNDDDDDDDDDDDSTSGSQKLSKADKRRMKKMAKRQSNA